eukprot:TRINITY_DN59911_c0_g2_i1.p1 TRINITY_DN59911_c0_g2~~TRINITY_DN59911_c0_g2_i1.p1  ORF type:complete len:146 (-),score=25.20 TRINITY_DN59911_c0_g2_i1:540-977(-)
MLRSLVGSEMCIRDRCMAGSVINASSVGGVEFVNMGEFAADARTAVVGGFVSMVGNAIGARCVGKRGSWLSSSNSRNRTKGSHNSNLVSRIRLVWGLVLTGPFKGLTLSHLHMNHQLRSSSGSHQLDHSCSTMVMNPVVDCQQKP